MSKRKTFVIDLDHTICIPNLDSKDTFERYGMAKPIDEMIEHMWSLRNQGHTLIIHTARRMKTHHGDVAKVIADVAAITKAWLAANNVPYDDLVFGKPYGDVYIDDKALNVRDLFPTDFPG